MSTSWDWANGVQETTQQKPTDPVAMNAWNAPQSPQGREQAPTMYSTISPGARVDAYSPVSSNNQQQLQPVQNAGYQNYQFEGQQYNNSQSPPVSPVKAPPSPPNFANLTLAPTMPAQLAAVVTPQPPVANPFDVFGAPAAPAPQQPAASNAPVVLFGAATLTPSQGSPAVSAPNSPSSSLPEEDDFWAQMGFGQIDHSRNDSTGSITSASDGSVSDASFEPEVNPHSLDERGLPLGGEYYKIRITTPQLGAIFSSASELRNTLYKTASSQFVESIKHRPVVSFRIDGSAAETSGVGVGHVLLKVNDQAIPDTDTAVKWLLDSPRPMSLEFYAPGNRQVQITKTEGQCMVKYDSRDSLHPRTSAEWKAKYVVIGDLLGKPNVVYMYRNKKEYDIAVREAQTSPRTLSVKVKQFDITGARILKRGQVRYPNQCSTWYYFVIVREFGLPIKISAESEEELAPVYDGIAGYLSEHRRRTSTPPKWMNPTRDQRTPSPPSNNW